MGLQVVPICGNVDSRIRRVIDGELDGVVVAAAGLARLGRIAEATELLDPQQMLPAPGQRPLGALADVVEDLRDDGRVVRRLSLRGVAATADGDLLRSSATGKLTNAENLGRHVAAELLDRGASAASGMPSAAGPTNIADGAPQTMITPCIDPVQ